jgi:signal peptidase I
MRRTKTARLPSLRITLKHPTAPSHFPRAIVAAVCALGVTLAWLVAPSAGVAQSPPATSGPTAYPKAPVTSQAAGAPFLTYAHALARGQYAVACAQLSKVVLRKAHAPSLEAARRVCFRQLRSAAKHLDQGRLRSLASTRVVKTRVEHGRARVTVQTTLYGYEPRATGTAVREDGRWKIARLPSGAHVGRSLVERIPSSSMAPTLRAGDTILVDQDAYRKGRPAIGDIVVFHPPIGAEGVGHCARRPPAGQACAAADRPDSEVLFVKRIVAGPGDRISIRDGHVIRNGTLAAEGFITPCGPGDEGCDFPRTFTVRAGRYYLLGDNRGASADSRCWGPIAAPSILGRVQRIGP